MSLWRILWKAEALFLVLLVGCSSIPKVPRVEDIGQGRAVVHLPRTADVPPITLEEEEFQQALRGLAREVRLTGTPRQTVERMFQMDRSPATTSTCPRTRSWCRWGRASPWKGR
jgi:hypothetical protein